MPAEQITVIRKPEAGQVIEAHKINTPYEASGGKGATSPNQ